MWLKEDGRKDRELMNDEIITQILRKMLPYLENEQMKILQEILQHSFYGLQISRVEGCIKQEDNVENSELLQKFIASKRVEGCSEKTLHYYESTIVKMFALLDKHVYKIRTDDLRQYLADYQKLNKCSQANIDNIRRILSSFFGWLEDENYILKSPVRRIHKIKTDKTVKETYTDEALEELRDHCTCLRDLALVDMLASTGMRVGELVKLNRADINFDNRECIVLGKGRKERLVYFDARTKIHLKAYLAERQDDNEALFVSLLTPHDRLNISGVEIRLRKLGRTLGINKVHPHKFRRTLATRAIDKGMPIEQVQRLLGHSKIDTTMEYAMVNQNNVKISHRKYIC